MKKTNIPIAGGGFAGDGLWVQVLRFYRMVDVAKYLRGEATAAGEEASRDDGLDVGSLVR